MEGPLAEIMIPDESFLILLSWIFKVKDTKEFLAFQWKQNPDVSGLILAGSLAAYTYSLPFPSWAGADIKGGGEGGK